MGHFTISLKNGGNLKFNDSKTSQKKLKMGQENARKSKKY